MPRPQIEEDRFAIAFQVESNILDDMPMLSAIAHHMWQDYLEAQHGKRLPGPLLVTERTPELEAVFGLRTIFVAGPAERTTVA
jgi:hypothetical protein